MNNQITTKVAAIEWFDIRTAPLNRQHLYNSVDGRGERALHESWEAFIAVGLGGYQVRVGSGKSHLNLVFQNDYATLAEARDAAEQVMRSKAELAARRRAKRAAVKQAAATACLLIAAVFGGVEQAAADSGASVKRELVDAVSGIWARSLAAQRCRLTAAPHDVERFSGDYEIHDHYRWVVDACEEAVERGDLDAVVAEETQRVIRRCAGRLHRAAATPGESPGFEAMSCFHALFYREKKK